MLPSFSFGHFLENLEFPWPVNKFNRNLFLSIYFCKRGLSWKMGCMQASLFNMYECSRKATPLAPCSLKVGIFKCQQNKIKKLWNSLLMCLRQSYYCWDGFDRRKATCQESSSTHIQLKKSCAFSRKIPKQIINTAKNWVKLINLANLKEYGILTA